MADETKSPDSEDAVAQSRLRLLTAWTKAEAKTRGAQATTTLERWRDRHFLVDVAARVFERDRMSAGTVLGSALAFRLFLFFVPFLLFVVGVAGFLANLVDADTVSNTTGVTGSLAQQISAAFDQPGSTRWLATLLGLVGMLTSGRSLVRVLMAASSLAWQVPVRLKAPVRVLASIIGIIVAIALLSALVNRVRLAAGLATAGLSLLLAGLFYGVAWLLLSLSLPRNTKDPGAELPGAVMVAGALVGLQAFTQLYLPSRVSQASQLYGTVGITIVTLGWFFILGRVMVLSLVVNAVVYERIGSVSIFVFSLPLVRVIPRRFPSVGRFFDLDREERSERESPMAGVEPPTVEVEPPN